MGPPRLFNQSRSKLYRIRDTGVGIDNDGFHTPGPPCGHKRIHDAMEIRSENEPQQFLACRHCGGKPLTRPTEFCQEPRAELNRGVGSRLLWIPEILRTPEMSERVRQFKKAECIVQVKRDVYPRHPV
jgi:hypothetical protein